MKNWFSSEKFAIVLIVTGIVLSISLVVLFWMDGYITIGDKISPAISGQFGDFIGGVVGALWALAGVILFYRALVRERSHAEQQEFHGIFFGLTNQYMQVVGSMDLRVTNSQGNVVHVQGADCFINFHKHLRTHWSGIGGSSDVQNQALIQKSIDDVYFKNRGDLVHYCGVCENVLYYIDSSSVLSKDKFRRIFANLVSSYERSFLFYFIFSSECTPELKSLLIDSTLFNNPSRIKFLNNQHHGLISITSSISAN